MLDAPNIIYALPKAASNTLTKFHYDPMCISKVITEKQNGTSRELIPYDLLDAPHNLHALSKTASKTCAKFHYDTISIIEVIGKDRMGPPGANPLRYLGRS